MPTKKTKIRKDGSVWSVVNTETGEVIKDFPNLTEAERYEEILNLGLPIHKDVYGPNILGKKSTHFVIDDNVVHPVEDNGHAYHVTPQQYGKPSPYFGDPTKPMGPSKIYELGGAEPSLPWIKPQESIDMESLQKHIRTMTEHMKPSIATDVRLDDFLRTVSMKDMLDAMFWQMAKKEGRLGVFSPTPDQYNEIMNYIFDNYIGPQDGSNQAPHNRTIAKKTEGHLQLRQLIQQLAIYKGIKSAKIIYDNFPEVVTITMTVDSELEFEDDEHAASWNDHLEKLFKTHKPSNLKRLEVMYNRMEVF